MLKSSGALGAATLLSRILGMVRVMIYARFMGDTWVAGAFYFAFQVPNLFRRLLGEGALSAALVPILKEVEVKQGMRPMWQTANAALSLLVCLCSVAVVLTVGATSFLLWLNDWSKETLLFLELLRLMSPYILMVCSAAVLMGICNVRGIFFLPALGSTMLNVAMILSVLFLTPLFGAQLEEKVFGLVVGVLLAGLLQMFFQLPVLFKEGFRPAFILPWRHPAIRDITGRMMAGIVGIAAFQINVIFTQWIAYREGGYVVASFEYAVRLMELPQGVIGISLATFLLTALSGLAAKKDFRAFQSTLKEGLGYVIFANIPAAVIMFLLAEPIVRLLFERGAFNAQSTFGCGFALQCLVPGLVFFSLVNVFARAFFALGDVKTPMRISIFCLVLNAVLAVLLIPRFVQGGMGMANTISSAINLALLVRALKRKLPGLEFRAVRLEATVVIGCTLVAGLLVWGTQTWLHAALGVQTLTGRLAEVFIPMILGGGVYLALAWLFNVKSAKQIGKLLRSKSR